MTWAISPVRWRPGDLLTRDHVCHLQRRAQRGGAVRRAVLDGVPELVRLDEVRPAV